MADVSHGCVEELIAATRHVDILPLRSSSPLTVITHQMLRVPQDGHVRVWDLRTPQCQAILPVNSHPCVAFDQQGLVFAVGADNGIIKLYDVGGYQQGPFDVFVVSGGTYA